jgi:leucyl-tRNA synthetase
MINAKEAFVYYEPEGLVMSRSGEECVVALTDQWYLDYGTPDWKAQAKKCLSQINTYGSETHNQFEQTLDWLHEWACARSFGLGTKLPWDPQFLVESLSDSTIYMAYYTVAHLLQGTYISSLQVTNNHQPYSEGSLDGSKTGPLGVKAEEMSDEVWHYILHDEAPFPAESTIPKDKLQLLKHQVQYFYPLDLRVSGKDLVPNHLTFFIYNHVALFPETRWPKAIRANGHLLLNNEKMSKSTGNFLTLTDAVDTFGADGTRFALADAGDSVEDANFQSDTANSAILRLFTQKEWIEETMAGINSLRTGPITGYLDRVFLNEMKHLVQQAEKAYDRYVHTLCSASSFYAK